MTKIKYINTDGFDYVPSETAFLECTKITNLKTGIAEFLSPDDKQFYVRMRHRYYYFVRELGRSYYDDVDQLGASIGVSPATATRIVAKLKKIGLIASNKPKRSNQWTITDITPENFLFERDINATKRKTAPEWVECLKHPVFGNAKEAPPAVQPEEQPEDVKADPMCELDEVPEGESPAPDKVKQKPKFTKKPAQKKTPASKQQALSPFDFKKPRDEAKDWFYLQSYNDADRFTVFTEFDLPYLAMFDSQGTLTNEYAIQHLKMKRELYTQQQIKRNNEQ